MSRVDELIAATKLSELVNKKEEDKQCKNVLWALAIVGAIAAVAGVKDYAPHGCTFTFTLPVGEVNLDE